MSAKPSKVGRRKKLDTSNLFQRGETWYCRIAVSGKRTAVSLFTNDVEVAVKARDRLLLQAEDLRAGRTPARVYTWEDAVEGYLEFQEKRVSSNGLAESAAKRYTTSIVQISLALEACPLSEITNATIRDFVFARRDDEKAASTIKNDLTAWSSVLRYAEDMEWISENPAKSFDRRRNIGHDAEALNPPNDVEVSDAISEISEWSNDMAKLVRWLRETGMRLGEALKIQAADIHPDKVTATLRHGVKMNRLGTKTRTISLGRAAPMLASMPKTGRLFAALSDDSAVVSTRYGQWCRQRQSREERVAEKEGRKAIQLRRWRLHDLRHAYAIASLIDDDTGVYRLMEHLGHSTVKTTELYARYLRGDGAQRRYSRREELFGSLPPREGAKAA